MLVLKEDTEWLEEQLSRLRMALSFARRWCWLLVGRRFILDCIDGYGLSIRREG